LQIQLVMQILSLGLNYGIKYNKFGR